MGGLVARKAFLTPPRKIAAIVTVSTPHNGSYTANNAANELAYLQEIITKVDNAVSAGGIALLGPIIGPIVAYFGHQKISEAKTTYLTFFPSATDPAVQALRAGSPEIAALQASTGDASLPRAVVYGVLPSVRNFPIRILASYTNQDFISW